MRNLDNELLQQLYQRYRRELYLYIYSLCRNHSMVEDILHDTFLKAILSLPDYHTNMQAWLYVVARNLCFNSLKKNRKMVLTEQVQDLQDSRQIRENLLDAFVVKEQKQQLYEALFKLPEQKREVLLLQYFSRFSQKEIAAILHLTPENVRVLSYRGKKELKSILEVYDNDIS